MINNLNPRSAQLNIWEILGFFKKQWRWYLIGAVLGAVLGLAFYSILPPKFEATVVISPARVGSLTAGITGNSVVQGSEPESAALMVERLKQPSFFTEVLRQSCQVANKPGYQSEMAKSLNATVVKLPNATAQSLSLAKVSWNAPSPEVASDCILAVVRTVTQAQNAMAGPVIAKLAAQKKVTQAQVDLYSAQLTALEARGGKEVSPANFNQIVIGDKAAQNLRESLAFVRKQLTEEDAQLSAPYTQSVSQLEPVYASPEPIITAKAAVSIGILVGLFLVALTLLLRQSVQRYRFEIEGQ